MATDKKKFKVFAYKWPKAKRKIGAYNKRAQKLGFPRLNYEILNERSETYSGSLVTHEGDKRDYTVEHDVFDLEIDTSEVLKLKDWSLKGTIESSGTRGMNYVWMENSKSYRKKYHSHDMSCDHCGLSRGRKKCAIVSHKSKGVKIVGISCLKDFIGHPDPMWWVRLAGILTLLEEEEKEESVLSHGTRIDSTLEVLRAASLQVILFGYQPKSNGFGYCTQDIARAIMNGLDGDKTISGSAKEILENASKEVRSKSEEHARKTLEFWRGRSIDQCMNNFERNIWTALQNDYVKPKHFGIVCYAVEGFRKLDLKEREEADRRIREVEEAEKIDGTSNKCRFLNQRGERHEVKLRYKKSLVFAGYYDNDSYMHFFKDMDGNDFVWSSSKSMVRVWNDFLEGQESTENKMESQDEIVNRVMIILGTIKGHSTYNCRNQTFINRCHIMSIIDVEKQTSELSEVAG